MEILAKDLQTITRYFRDVLGVQNLILKENNPGEGELPNSRIEFQLLKPLSGPAQTLFEKMLSAMKLKSGEYGMNSSGEVGTNSLVVVRFVEEVSSASQQLADSGGQMVIETWSPETLLLRPELKKKVWEDLQIAMRQIEKNKNLGSL